MVCESRDSTDIIEGRIDAIRDKYDQPVAELRTQYMILPRIQKASWFLWGWTAAMLSVAFIHWLVS